MTKGTRSAFRACLRRRLKDHIEVTVNDEAITREIAAGKGFDRELRKLAIDWEWRLKRAVDRIVR